MKSNEKGSVTLIVLVTILFIVILLSSFLVYVNTKRRAQINQTKEREMNAVYREVAIKELSEVTGMETENTEVQDKNGNKILIPAGFKVVNPEEDVTKGIVIEDVTAGDSTSKGNQYVWIPVTHVNGEKINTLRDDRGNEHIIELARYTFDVGTLDSSTNKYNGTGNITSKLIDGSAIAQNIRNYYGYKLYRRNRSRT